MSKATILADLYKKSMQEYTRTPAEWKGLLSCVSRYYKYSFDNGVLIYAQKPDATQLATFDVWNEKIERRINRGAKSIAVIDMANPNASIKYLFDLMDTNGSEQTFKKVLSYHWELEDQYKSSLLIKFHGKYSTPTSSIELCLYRLVQRQVREILPKHMANFKVRDESSILYDVPLEAVKAEFTDLVTNSVAYTVFQKCGLSTEIFKENAFENISHFNSLELFMAMGSCTVSLLRPILKEINQEIENIKIERSQVYENRTVNETDLHRRRGRDDVSQSANLGERENGQNADRQIREAVEELHDGEPPAPLVGTGGTGQNQRNYTGSGRGSGAPQGSTDTAALDGTADTGHREPTGTSRSHDYADPHSGGNHNQRGSAESPLTPPQSRTEPPTDGKKPSVGGFFVVPKSEPISEPPLPAPQENTTVQTADRLDDEEISDLVDEVLCADDVTEDTREWLSEIYRFFEGGHKLSSKANVMKAFYGKLNAKYTAKTGEYLKIAATENNLYFSVGGQTYSFSYRDLAQKVDNLILMGAYPFSSTDSMIDDYAIPDEVDQMQGTAIKDDYEKIADEIHVDANTPAPPTKQEIIDKIICKNTTYAEGKGRIYKAMLSMLAKKDRVALLKYEYGTGGSYGSLENGGHSHIDYDGKGIHIDYLLDGVEVDERLSWNVV